MHTLRAALGSASLLLLIATAVGCGNGNSVTSDEQARRAYLGLDKSISKSLALGFAGYNAASTPTSRRRWGPVTSTGTLTITGHVDQGNPSQASMGLNAEP